MSRDKYPLVSVRIVSYNQESYITECIESVLEQDYPNIEIIVSDDGSTDRTQEIIKSFYNKYPNKFKLALSNVNQGITKNVNAGLKLCEGKYIVGLGGDDIYIPGKISAQVVWMESSDKRVLCGHQVEVFYDDGSSSHPLTNFFCSGAGPKVFLEYGNCPYASVSIMVRASALPPHGFDERLPAVSDYLCWVECLGDNGEYGYVDGVYARYRRHSSNITNDPERCLVDIMKTYEILQKKYPRYTNVLRETKWFTKEISHAKALRIKKKYIKWFLSMMKIVMLSPKRFLRTVWAKATLRMK